MVGYVGMGKDALGPEQNELEAIPLWTHCTHVLLSDPDLCNVDPNDVKPSA